MPNPVKKDCCNFHLKFQTLKHWMNINLTGRRKLIINAHHEISDTSIFHQNCPGKLRMGKPVMRGRRFYFFKFEMYNKIICLRSTYLIPTISSVWKQWQGASFKFMQPTTLKIVPLKVYSLTGLYGLRFVCLLSADITLGFVPTAVHTKYLKICASAPRISCPTLSWDSCCVINVARSLRKHA